MTTIRKSVSEKAEKHERVIYIGPNLSGGRLSFATNFIDGFPDHIKAIIDEYPWFRQLFVPVAKMNSAMEATKKKGDVLHTLYQRAQKEV